MKLLGLVVVAAACGPGFSNTGLYAQDVQTERAIDRDRVGRAANDPKAMSELLFEDVVIGGIWFADPACAAEFGHGGQVPKARRDAFATCLVGLHMQPSVRMDALSDVVVLDYSPGIELEARINGEHLTWIGYASRRGIDAELPTITPSALELLRTSGDRNGPPATSFSDFEYAWLRVCLDERGAVTLADPFLTTSVAAQRAFVAAAKAWTFNPLVLGGTPTAACAMVRMSAPPDRRGETLPMPPGEPRSHKRPLVLETDSPAAKSRQLVVGTKFIAPDDDTKTQIQKSRVARVVSAFRICVDEQGAPESLLLVHTSGFLAYDRKLVAEMQKWRYEPFLVDGAPVPVCAGVTFIYSQR